MTAIGIDRVVLTLEGNGYRALPAPFEVANVPFEFAAALVGPETTLDLVVVADTLREAHREVLRQVDALAHALDVVDSRRTLTVVLVGPRPASEILNSLAARCRVLPVGVINAAQVPDLENWLSMFAPLNVPQTSEAAADPMDELQRSDHGMSDLAFQRLASAAERSAPDVELVFADTLRSGLTGLPEAEAP
jgi:hypothetical protein